MLSVQEAFKFGFLHKCASLGLSDAAVARTAERAQQYLEKSADVAGTLGSIGRTLTGGVTGTVSALSPWMAATAIGAPVAGGYALGHTAGRLNDADDTDIDDVKKQELIEAYRRVAARTRPRPPQPPPRKGRR